MTMLKTPSEQVKIAKKALKWHEEALEKAEADLAEHAKRGDTLDSNIRECRHAVEKAKLDLKSVEAKASTNSDPQLQLDKDTVDLLAGLRKTLRGQGETVAWGAVDKKHVDALSLVLNLVADQAAKLNNAKNKKHWW